MGTASLALPQLVDEVLAVNPTLAAMVAAWQAAAERYPQVVALDDPMFTYMQGLPMGWMVEGSQRVPWPGKRTLDGQVARARANAACHEVADTRLRLVESAQMAYFDYFLVARLQELNAATVQLMEQFRSVARTRYETAAVPFQDVLEANVELADLEARAAELNREQRIAAARINTLLHRDPYGVLAPAPADLPVPSAIAPVETLVAVALAQRPDLAAEAARICAEEAALARAWKDYYPDVDLAFKHDHFMPSEMQNQVGLNLSVPLWQQKRAAAVREACARLQQQRAQYEERADAIRFDVQAAASRAIETRRIVDLYRQRIIPTTEQSAQAAQSAYVAGQIDFLRLIEIQKRLQQQRAKQVEALVEYHRQAAALERAVGGIVPAAN